MDKYALISGKLKNKLLDSTFKMIFAKRGDHVPSSRWRHAWRDLNETRALISAGDCDKVKVTSLCLNQMYWRRVLQYALIQRQRLVWWFRKFIIMIEIFCGEKGKCDLGLFRASLRLVPIVCSKQTATLRHTMSSQKINSLDSTFRNYLRKWNEHAPNSRWRHARARSQREQGAH